MSWSEFSYHPYSLGAPHYNHAIIVFSPKPYSDSYGPYPKWEHSCLDIGQSLARAGASQGPAARRLLRLRLFLLWIVAAAVHQLNAVAHDHPHKSSVI